MQVRSLGHVVLKVRDQQRAEAFYGDLLGIPIAARLEAWSMTFFTLGNHHDFAIAAVGDDTDPAPEKSPGLLHVAFNIGTSTEELRQARAELEAAGISVEAYDHGVTRSLLRGPRRQRDRALRRYLGCLEAHPGCCRESNPS